LLVFDHVFVVTAALRYRELFMITIVAQRWGGFAKHISIAVDGLARVIVV